ncbi:MAG: deaminase [Patescibacteria group bacterium]
MINHEHYFSLAAQVATHATCGKDLCGAVIVNNDLVIGEGWNSPAGNGEDQRTCEIDDYDWMKKKKSDKTCCIHAEWRSIMDALRTHPNEIVGSTLYFTRVDTAGEILQSGEPYCTVCSRLALDVGISYFALWQDFGIRLYSTSEYNQQSYAFHRTI